MEVRPKTTFQGSGLGLRHIGKVTNIQKIINKGFIFAHYVSKLKIASHIQSILFNTISQFILLKDSHS
jgi:hypothetical protein